jgi:hypothetical protein
LGNRNKKQGSMRNTEKEMRVWNMVEQEMEEKFLDKEEKHGVDGGHDEMRTYSIVGSEITKK